MADAAPAPVLASAVTRYRWWREHTGSFDTRQELASTSGVFIVNLGATLEITDARARTIRVGAGQAFIGGMAQGTSFSRSTGAMEGIHVFMPVQELGTRDGGRRRRLGRTDGHPRRRAGPRRGRTGGSHPHS